MQRRDGSAEVVSHAILRLVADLPGEAGRIRAARIVGGYSVAYRTDGDMERFAKYAVGDVDWSLRELTALVDALIAGGLVAQVPPPRPTLVLTRAGHRALDALEGTTTRRDG